MSKSNREIDHIMFLDQARPGDALEVVAVERGHQAAKRLMQMGLVPGARLVVETVHPFSGPIVVNIDGSRIAIGRKLARSIETASVRQ